MNTEDNQRAAILAARKPVSPQATERAAKDVGATGSIAPQDHSPFVSSIKSNRGSGAPSGHPSALAHKWADRHLKESANRMERVILAVRDAARCAERKGFELGNDEIYVTAAIRKGWNLTPDQLSKGLKSLEERQMIRFTNSRKGRHARFIIT